MPATIWEPKLGTQIPLHILLASLWLVPATSCCQLLCSAWAATVLPQLYPDSALPHACVLQLLPPVLGLTFGSQRHKKYRIHLNAGAYAVWKPGEFPTSLRIHFWQMGDRSWEYILRTSSLWIDPFEMKFVWFLREQIFEVKKSVAINMITRSWDLPYIVTLPHTPVLQVSSLGSYFLKQWSHISLCLRL